MVSLLRWIKRNDRLLDFFLLDRSGNLHHCGMWVLCRFGCMLLWLILASRCNLIVVVFVSFFLHSDSQIGMRWR